MACIDGDSDPPDAEAADGDTANPGEVVTAAVPLESPLGPFAFRLPVVQC